MIDLRKLIVGSGYQIKESDEDTTNINCRRGHIYQDGQFLVASLDSATKIEDKALRKLGTPIMDGDFGELSVKFAPGQLKDVVRILKPRQARRAKLAA